MVRILLSAGYVVDKYYKRHQGLGKHPFQMINVRISQNQASRRPNGLPPLRAEFVREKLVHEWFIAVLVNYSVSGTLLTESFSEAHELAFPA